MKQPQDPQNDKRASEATEAQRIYAQVNDLEWETKKQAEERKKFRAWLMRFGGNFFS